MGAPHHHPPSQHTMLAQSPLVVAPPLQGGSSTSHRPSSSVDGHRRRVSMPITPPETPDRAGFSGAQTVPTHYVETLPTPPESPASAKSFATQATQGVLSLATDAWQNEKQQWSHKARGHSRVLSYGDALAPTASYTRIAQRSLFTPSRVITVTLIIFTTVYAILLIVPPIRSRAEVAQATKSPLVALATPEVRPAMAAAALAANEPNESLDGYRAVERSSESRHIQHDVPLDHVAAREAFGHQAAQRPARRRAGPNRINRPVATVTDDETLARRSADEARRRSPHAAMEEIDRLVHAGRLHSADADSTLPADEEHEIAAVAGRSKHRKQARKTEEVSDDKFAKPAKRGAHVDVDDLLLSRRKAEARERSGAQEARRQGTAAEKRKPHRLPDDEEEDIPVGPIERRVRQFKRGGAAPRE